MKTLVWPSFWCMYRRSFVVWSLKLYSIWSWTDGLRDLHLINQTKRIMVWGRPRNEHYSRTKTRKNLYYWGFQKNRTKIEEPLLHLEPEKVLKNLSQKYYSFPIGIKTFIYFLYSFLACKSTIKNLWKSKQDLWHANGLRGMKICSKIRVQAVDYQKGDIYWTYSSPLFHGL